MKAVPWLVGVGVLALVMCGCSDSGLSGSALLAPKTYGSGQDAFAVSFTKTPTTVLPVLGQPSRTTTPTTQPPPSTATPHPTPPSTRGSRLNWFGGAVNVAVMPHDGVPPDRIEARLRSYLPFATGGRMYLLDGMPAIKEVVDCSTPAGPCPGKTAGLEVLDGSILFDVFVSGLNEAGTDQAFSSFRVVSVAKTPGCSYGVNRKGFTQHCVTRRQVVATR